MKYAELLSVLKENQNKELVFEFDHGNIRRDYHITEVFNTSVQAIDCGGAVDSWKETVLQLLEPGYEDGERFMEAKKALGILEKSAKLIDLHQDGNLILEYKPKDSTAAQRYNVSSIESKDGKVFVKTAGATTQCKAADRKVAAGGEASACCGPKVDSSSQKESACCGPAPKVASTATAAKSACCG